MGCLCSALCDKPMEEQLTHSNVQYSWETRKAVDPTDFIVENLHNKTVVRNPGTVKGQQFIIQNCQDCNIYIFDHTAMVTIDDCNDCRIFLGPTKSSLFVRDCYNCNIMTACQQFRTRDCKHLVILLSCVTKPIIESSTDVSFGCFQFYYAELEGQFDAAGLSVYNNYWSDVHDFTPVGGETNFRLLTDLTDTSISEYLRVTAGVGDVPVNTERYRSVVPTTLGLVQKPTNESCLVAFFGDYSTRGRIKSFIKTMLESHPDCLLLQTKEVTLTPDYARRVFGDDRFSKVIDKGPVVGLEYNGPGVCRTCDGVLQSSRTTDGLTTFVSHDPTSAETEIEHFYNFANLQMSI